MKDEIADVIGDGSPPSRSEARAKLADFAKARRLTQGKLAEMLGVSRQWVNSLVTGRASITPDIAQRLAHVSGLPALYWLGPPPDGVSAHASEGRRRTRAGPAAPRVLVDVELDAFLSSGVVSPFTPDNIQPASYDLTMGAHAVVIGLGKVDLVAKPFVLRPGGTAVIQTMEVVALPGTHFGRIGPISELPRHALFLSAGLQVDPGYRGALFVSIHNHGERDYSLYEGRSFLSLEVHCLGVEAESPYSGEYLGKTEVEDLVPRQAPPKVSEDSFTLTSLDRADLALINPVHGTFEFLGGNWVARATELGLSAVGPTRDDALAKLRMTVASRFSFLDDQINLRGRLRQELERLEAMVSRRHFIGVPSLEALARDLEADITAGYGGNRIAAIQDSGEFVALFDIPPPDGEITVGALAEALGVSEDQVSRLLAREATRSDYLLWLAGNPA